MSPTLLRNRKQSAQDLALAGKEPLFTTPLHVGRPNIGNREALFRRISEALDRRWLTNQGPLVQEFESKLKELTGARHCIPVCNATVGLEIAIRATGMTGEVILPSFTFVATAHALQWQQITPVFCDVAPGSHHIDPQCVEDLITPKTTGILGVHLWGRACDTEALETIARRHHLALIFDAAHALGCSHQGKMIGQFGKAEVFSFHATKFLNSFEGGVIATNDDDLAAQIRLMLNFGFAGYDCVVYVGTNGKMSEISAAMGLTGLDSMDEFIAANRRNYNQYGERLAGLRGVTLWSHGAKEKNNFQYIVAEIDEKKSGIHRDDLLALLHAENVLARRYFYPGCHRMEPYRSLYPQSRRWLPRTEELVQRILILPTGTAVSEAEIEGVTDLIRIGINEPENCLRLLRKGEKV
jgi:dTDP-4-amino-4,6-dideoxygalactose transaminase